MDVYVRQGNILEVETDALVVNLFKGVTRPGGATGAVDKALDHAISELIRQGDLDGSLGQVAVLYPRGAIPAKRVLIVGLGEAEKFDLEAARRAAAAAAKKARALKAQSLTTIVHGAGVGGLDPRDAAQAVVEGTLLALYTFPKYQQKAEETPSLPSSLTIVEFDAAKVPALEEGARVGRIVAESVAFTRNLVMEPPNIATPAELARRAREMAEEVGLHVEVLTDPQLEELGMGLILGVGQGSANRPHLVVLEHNRGREDLPTVVLVGKGITFDTGGISLKRSQDMWRMKHDMAGAAAVLGAMRAIALLDLPLHVVSLTPFVENMPDGRAYRPADVLRNVNGKTVEVINTDAEGRLILADALGYAARYTPDAVVDLATLTGSQGIALGDLAAALFSNDDTLAQELMAVAPRVGERVWRMPLWDEYKEALRSDVAEVKNAGSRTGSLPNSAKFLEHFTEGYPWAHLDIASLVWVDTPKDYRPKGATGYGVRLLVEWLRTRSA